MPSRACKRDDRSVRSACEGNVGRSKKCFSLNLTCLVAFPRLNRSFGPTYGVRNSHFSGGRIFKNTLRTFESERLERTENACPQFSGGRFCQVVARTGSTVPQEARALNSKSHINWVARLDILLPCWFYWSQVQTFAISGLLRFTEVKENFGFQAQLFPRA